MIKPTRYKFVFLSLFTSIILIIFELKSSGLMPNTQ